MGDNGSRLLFGGIAAFLASLLLFCLLLRLLTSQTARFMRLLGQSPKAIRKRFAKTIPFWTVPSVLFGAILCRIGYGWVTGKLLSSALTFDYRIAGLVALAEAMVICIALLLTGAATAKTKPMRGGRK